MFNFIASWHREREAVRELSRLTDLELVDLGIARSGLRELARSGLSEAGLRGSGEAADAMAPAWGAHVRRSAAA